MAEIYDCTSEREYTILLNRLNRSKMDSNYTLYFDESGNTRCFWIKEGKYNVDPFVHFVLGGIVANNSICFEEAKQKIGCNSTVKEIKSKYVYRGSFEECLKNKKLENYLDLLIEQKWFVHFSVVELFYFGIVDIVDSIVDNDVDVFSLKNELNKVLRFNKDKTLNMMIKYNYPNISVDDKNNFLKTCIDLVDDYRTNNEKGTNDFTYKLRMNLLLAQNKDELVFIQDEEIGSLLKDFLFFYQRPIYMFKNSQIIFDEELSIQDKIGSYDLAIDGKVLANYSFVNSTSNVMVQLSDVFVGILARYFRFINTNIAEVESQIEKFDKQQLFVFNKLNYILNISFSENSAFWDMFLCIDMKRTFSSLVDKYSSIT